MTLISKRWWREARLRWASKTVGFFIKLKMAAIASTAVATVILGILKWLESEGAEIPGIAKYACIVIIGFGGGSAATANLPTNNPEVQEPKPPVE